LGEVKKAPPDRRHAARRSGHRHQVRHRIARACHAGAGADLGAALRDVLREFWFLPVAIAVGAWLGTRLLIAAPPEPFLLVLAFVMLLYLNLDRLGRGHSERVQRQRAVFGIAFGFAAGV